jgi:argininosuccinate lyase
MIHPKEIIGHQIGGKLHTGRSRNDQVATDTRLWTLEAVTKLNRGMTALLDAMVEKAEE